MRQWVRIWGKGLVRKGHSYVLLGVVIGRNWMSKSQWWLICTFCLTAMLCFYLDTAYRVCRWGPMGLIDLGFLCVCVMVLAPSGIFMYDVGNRCMEDFGYAGGLLPALRIYCVVIWILVVFSRYSGRVESRARRIHPAGKEPQVLTCVLLGTFCTVQILRQF